MSERAQRALHELQQALAGRDPHELDNLALDLGALRQRLLAGEYIQTDFEVRNVFDVQRRTREYLAYFAGWNRQSSRWAALLSTLLRDGDEVLDLCPGWAPKIELALLKLEFRGRVCVLDKDRSALEHMADFLGALAPRFSLEPVCADLFAEPVAAQGTLVVGNHLIDDVLFEIWTQRQGLDPFDVYEDEGALRSTWQRLLDDADALMDEFPPRLAAALAGHVRPGGRLVLSHYPSNVERLVGEPRASELFHRVFEGTQAALRAAGLVSRPLQLAEPSRRFNERTVVVLERPA